MKKNDIRLAEQVRVETCDYRKFEMGLFVCFCLFLFFFPEFSVALNFYAVSESSFYVNP